MNVQCGICKDAIDVLTKHGDGGSVASALPCGHVFHSPCISQWLDQSNSSRQGSCPHCRSCVLKKQVLKLYLDLVPLENYEEDPAVIKAVNDNLKREIESLHELIAHNSQTKDKLTAINISLRERVLELEKELSNAQTRERIASLAQHKLHRRTKELENALDENKKLKNKLMSLQATTSIINGSLADARDALPVLEREDLEQLVCTYKKDVLVLTKRNESLFNDVSRGQEVTRKLRKELEREKNENSILSRIVEMYKPKRDSAEAKHPQQPKPSVLTEPLASNSDPDSIDLTSPMGPQVARKTNTPTIVTPNRKRPIRPQPFKIPHISRDTVPRESPVNFSYDGLGGHSRVEEFPKSRLLKRPKILLANKVYKG